MCSTGCKGRLVNGELVQIDALDLRIPRTIHLIMQQTQQCLPGFPPATMNVNTKARMA